LWRPRSSVSSKARCHWCGLEPMHRAEKAVRLLVGGKLSE